MLTLPAELTRLYEILLTQQGITMEHRLHYRKWRRYYWDFCHKYGRNRGSGRVFRRLTRSYGSRISLTAGASRRIKNPYGLSSVNRLRMRLPGSQEAGRSPKRYAGWSVPLRQATVFATMSFLGESVVG